MAEDQLPNQWFLPGAALFPQLVGETRIDPEVIAGALKAANYALPFSNESSSIGPRLAEYLAERGWGDATIDPRTGHPGQPFPNGVIPLSKISPCLAPLIGF